MMIDRLAIGRQVRDLHQRKFVPRLILAIFAEIDQSALEPASNSLRTVRLADADDSHVAAAHPFQLRTQRIQQRTIFHVSSGSRQSGNSFGVQFFQAAAIDQGLSIGTAASHWLAEVQGVQVLHFNLDTF